MYALLSKPTRPVATRSASRRPLTRRAEEAVPVMADAEAAAAGMSVTVEVVPASSRRFRSVVVRQITQYAVVEYDAAEGADPYAMTDAVVAGVPDSAWTLRGEPWAYIESSEPIEPAAADPEAEMPADGEQRSRPSRMKAEDLKDFAEIQDAIVGAGSLQELADILNAFDPYDYAENGSLKLGDVVDLSGLPVFSSNAPADTSGIFSWDDEFWLVNDGGGWVLEPRGDLESDEAEA